MSQFPSSKTQTELLDAIANGDGYYLACENGHGSLPPRRSCAHCRSTSLTEEPLPETATVVTYTETHLAGSSFDAETPYVVAIVDFGPVRMTGQIRDCRPEAIEIGMPVEVTTTSSSGTDDLVAFSPVE